MSVSYVPNDLAATPDISTSDTQHSSRLPSRPKSRPEKWDSAKIAAFSDKDNWRKWDALFKVLEESWAAAPSKEAADNVYSVVKSAFSSFLSRFPYSAPHWRQFSLLEYKMAGVDESVKCLKNAVDAYPQSVSLWVEYLTALMTVENASLGSKNDNAGAMTESKKEPDVSAKKEEQDSSTKTEPASVKDIAKTQHIRAEFSRAEAAIGLNFNSDPFWNKYVEFETSAAENNTSPELLHVYLRLIRIPLYQYAQYYNQFTELNKSFAVSDILSEAELPKYLETFGKSSLDELSVIEQHQLVDTYSYDIFTETQAQVTKKWPFEAALTIQEYSMDADLVNGQTEEWIKYLDAEIASFSTISERTKSLHYDLIVSLFERALVPNCTNVEVWQKYVDFVEKHASPDVSFDIRNRICRKAIFTFLPLKHAKFRENYANMLAAHDFDTANEFCLEALRLYSGSTGSKVYVKEAYVHDLAQICKLWVSKVAGPDVIIAFENLITTYFNRVDRYQKDNGPKVDKDLSKTQKTAELKSAYTNTLSKYLNDDGICVIAVHLMRFLSEEPEDTLRIRKFYNNYHTESAFSRSVQFWRFFVDFEGYNHKNLTNLRSVVHYLKTTTALPKMAIDAFLDIYYELTCCNLAQAASLSGNENYLDILVHIDAEKSDDLYVNRSARTRLARNNYFVSDKGPSKEEALMKMRAKHVAHPGVFIENKPEITNRLMDQEWISLLDDDVKPPVLPTFRNLDKANVPINYPDE